MRVVVGLDIGGAETDRVALSFDAAGQVDRVEVVRRVEFGLGNGCKDSGGIQRGTQAWVPAKRLSTKLGFGGEGGVESRSGQFRAPRAAPVSAQHPSLPRDTMRSPTTRAS